MSLILLRDDDANATTDPDALARGYAPLFDGGHPVCFAVIPNVALDVRGPDGRREGFVSPDAPDEPSHRPLGPETPLAVWLRRHEQQADVFLHGLTHERVREGTELGALSRAEASARIEDAVRRMRVAIDRVPIGFVAPWDAVSRGALEAVTGRFDLFSTGFVDRRRLPPRAWLGHVRERLVKDGAVRVGRSWVLRHGGCRITGETRAEDVPAIVEALGRGARVTVVVLHHWHFGRGPEPHPAVRALARALQGRRVGGVRDAVQELDGG